MLAPDVAGSTALRPAANSLPRLLAFLRRRLDCDGRRRGSILHAQLRRRRETMRRFLFRENQIRATVFPWCSTKTDWPPGRAGSSSPLSAPKTWRTTLWIWIYCNPLKSHKTAKTFFGKAWQKIALIWKGLEKAWRRRDRAGRSRRLQAMTAPIDSIISPRRLI
jgi:hypothetical protein